MPLTKEAPMAASIEDSNLSVITKVLTMKNVTEFVRGEF